MPLSPNQGTTSAPDRVVQGLWVGDRLGPLQDLSIRSFLANGHSYHLYTYGKVDGVPEGTSVLDASAIVPKREVFRNPDGFGHGSYAAFSDLFRYRLLYEVGGWWVDSDVVCMKPLVFGADYVFASERTPEGDVTTASCAFTAPAGADVLRYCLEVCDFKDPQRLAWGEIGPRLLEDAIWRFGLEKSRVPVDYFNPVHYYEFRDFTDPGFDFERLFSSYGVHLWHQMWVNAKVDPGRQWPADSLVGMLKERYLP